MLIELLTTNKHDVMTSSSSYNTTSRTTILKQKVIPVPMTIALSSLVVLVCGLFVDYHFPVRAAFSNVVEGRTTLRTLAKHNKTMIPSILLLLLLGLLEGGCCVRRLVQPE